MTPTITDRIAAIDAEEARAVAARAEVPPSPAGLADAARVLVGGE